MLDNKEISDKSYFAQTNIGTSEPCSLHIHIDLGFLKWKKIWKKCSIWWDNVKCYLLTSIKIRSVGWVDETDEDTNLTISITFWHLIGTFNWFWLGVHKKCQFLTGCWQKKWKLTSEKVKYHSWASFREAVFEEAFFQRPIWASKWPHILPDLTSSER